MCVIVDCKDTIHYPATSVSLNGSATSINGIRSVSWKSIGITSAIANNSVDTTSAILNIGGLYVYLFTATSNTGLVSTAYDSVIYIQNQPPVAITGSQIATITGMATLSGSLSTDPEGLPLTYNWTQVSGPNTATLSSTTSANPQVSGLITGTYVFSLKVTDSGGLTSIATQTVVMTLMQVKTVIVTTKYYSDGSTVTTTTTTTP